MTSGELTLVFDGEDPSCTPGVGDHYKMFAGTIHSDHTGHRVATVLISTKQADDS